MAKTVLGSIEGFDLTDDGETAQFEKEGDAYCFVSQRTVTPLCPDSERVFAHHWEDRFDHVDGQMNIRLRPSECLWHALDDIIVSIRASFLQKTWGEDTGIILEPQWLGGLLCLPPWRQGGIWLAARRYRLENLEPENIAKGKAFADRYVRGHLARLLSCNAGVRLEMSKCM